MNTFKKLLMITFLFFLVTYGCHILTLINLDIFMYVFNAWQDFEFYNVLFSIYTACAIGVITMYLLHKKKN